MNHPATIRSESPIKVASHPERSVTLVITILALVTLLTVVATLAATEKRSPAPKALWEYAWWE